jgi:hypothetical protein
MIYRKEGKFYATTSHQRWEFLFTTMGEKEVEFWKATEILDFLKEGLFNGKPGLIGHAKQILAYRDWVGHGKNPKKPPSTDMKPVAAYNTLNEIVETLLLYPPPNIVQTVVQTKTEQ